MTDGPSPPPGLWLRLARADDAGDIARMSRTEIERGLDWRWTPWRVWDSVHDEATHVVLAERGETMVGFAIMRYDDDRAHLCLLAVHPRHRRRGVGAALVTWLERSARVAGIARVSLEAREDNAGALAFYARLGFQRVAVVAGLYQGVCDGVRLQKDLA